ADSDPDEDLKEDSKDGLVDYPADGGDDDDSSDDNEEDKEHLALADSVDAPVVDPVPFSEEIEPFKTNESTTTPPPPTVYHTTPECLASCLTAHALPSPPHPIVPYPWGSPNHVRAPRGFRAAMGRLRASSPSAHHLLHPSPPLPPLLSSLYLPPPVPTSLPLLVRCNVC
nr:hypothetical protein [Tanacetum cinerariifolium]